MNEKLVSIIVPAYNHEKYILDCLNSVFYQDYENIELIIADDGSSDNTYELAKKWCDDNKRRFIRCLIYQNESNVGITKNVNGLISKSNGEYIKSIASDDILEKDAISSLVDYLEKHDNEIVFSNAIRIDGEASYPVDKEVYRSLLYKSVPANGNALFKKLLRGSFIAAPTVMFRKKTFDKYGLYREDLLYEDWEYWLRLAFNGVDIGYLDKVTVGYRVLDTSASHFSRGKSEEKRFREVIINEKKMLSGYVNSVEKELNDFWRDTIIICMNNDYHHFFNEIIGDWGINVRGFSIKVRVIMYKICIYAFIRNIFSKIK